MGQDNNINNSKSNNLSNYIGILSAVFAIIIVIVTLFSNYGKSRSVSAVNDASNSIQLTHLKENDSRQDIEIKQIREALIITQQNLIKITGQVENLSNSLNQTNEIFREMLKMEEMKFRIENELPLKKETDQQLNKN